MNILTTSACRKFICKCIQSQRANLVAMSTVNFLLPNFSSHPLQYHIGNRENWWWVILNQFDDFVPHRRIKSPPIFDSQLIWHLQMHSSRVLLYKYLPSNNGSALYTVRASSLYRMIKMYTVRASWFSRKISSKLMKQYSILLRHKYMFSITTLYGS